MYYYGNQAYNSKTSQLLDANYNRPDTRMTRLPMGHARQRIPYTIFSQYTPKHMRIYAKKDPRPAWLKNDRYGAVNERYIRPINFSKLGNILVQCMRIGKVVTIFSIIISLIDKFLSSVIGGKVALFNHMTVDYILVGIPLCIWLASWLIYTLFPVKHGQGSPWELNRQTGLVSQFIYNKDKPTEPPQIISVPFVEMDAFVLPILGRFGYTFLFYLKHRHSDMMIQIGDMIGPVTAMTRYEELWDFIQNYMDISQPLPDIPLFEEFRSKDPVTNEHDKQTGRHQHYWLEMTDKEWNYQLIHNPLIQLSAKTD